MQIERKSNNFLQVNTYFLVQDENCLVVDPGSNEEQVIQFINKNHLNLKGIILTHAHFDHFSSCNVLNRLYDVPIYVHHSDIPLLYDPEKNLSAYFAATKKLVLSKKIPVVEIDEQVHEIAGFNLRVLHVPGHSPGGICLYFKEQHILISGDALFKRSIGRTDFGDLKQLLKNIKAKLFKLPDDTIVYPGHGDNTDIGSEKKLNPYIK